MSYTPVTGLFRVRMASTANLTLSGTQTIDGIVGASGDLVLAKDQTTGSQNGLYVMVAGAWSRLAGADNAAEMPAGSLIVVSVGTANAGKIFELTTAAGFVVGTNTLTFTLATSASSLALASTAPADINGTAAVGVGTTAARADHVHALNASITTSADETAAFPASRQWANGTNTTVDLTTAGKIKINSTAAGATPAVSVTDVAPTGPSVVGVSLNYARQDHAHFHGDLPGGLLHALVNEGESGQPGFMSLAQNNKLEGIADNATFSPIENAADPSAISDTTAAPGVGTTASAFDHVHPHGQRGAGTDVAPLHTLATNEAPGFMAAADHSALALWDVTKCRYYFLDNELGNDTHVGFLDRTPGHSFGGGEMAAVDAAKIKTVERLLQILPRNGNGRMAKILFKSRSAGTCYLMADGVTLADLDLTGVHGYRWLGRCGSTDFQNGTNDRTNVGATIAVAGPNGDFSFTALTAGANGITIAAGSFGTDAVTTGWRARFTGNVTPAVANLCLPIYRINSTTSLSYGHVAFPAPDVGDKFFIERIGVTFNNIFDLASATTMTAADATTEMVSPMAGLQAQADTGGGQFRMGAVGKTQYAFCSSRNAGGGAVPRAFSNPDAGHVVISDVYRDEVGLEWPVGPCKVDSTMELQAATLEVAQGGLFCATDTTARVVSIKASNLTIGHGTQFRQGLAVELAGAGPNRIGDGNTTAPVRLGLTDALGAAVLLRAGSASVICNGWIFDTTESATDYGIVVTGGPRAGVNVETLGSGPQVGFQHITDGGITTRGVKISDCWQGRFYLDSTTVSFGTGGYEVCGQGGHNVTLAMNFTGHNSLIDYQGNETFGTAGRVNSECQFVKCGNDAVAEGDIVSVLSASGGINQSALTEAGSATNFCFGVAMNDMPGTFVGYGYIATQGTPFINGAGGYGPGDIVYLDPVTQGKTVNVSPGIAPGVYKQRLGMAWATSRLKLAIETVAVLADGNP